jgi:hypothetical protein
MFHNNLTKETIELIKELSESEIIKLVVKSQNEWRIENYKRSENFLIFNPIVGDLELFKTLKVIKIRGWL